VLQCAAVCRSVLQCAAAYCYTSSNVTNNSCCSVLQRVAVRCDESSNIIKNNLCCSVLQRIAAYGSVFQCVAACHPMSRKTCVAVCCSVLQCVAGERHQMTQKESVASECMCEYLAV